MCAVKTFPNREHGRRPRILALSLSEMKNPIRSGVGLNTKIRSGWSGKSPLQRQVDADEFLVRGAVV